jgi:hypothetical protein
LKTILCPNCGQQIAGSPCPFCHHPVAIDGPFNEPNKDNLTRHTSELAKQAKLISNGKHTKRKLSSKNPYIWTGLSLIIIGALLIPVSLFLFTFTWLTALGIAVLILSFILLALGRTIPKLSPQASALLLETGIDNLATVFEELGVKSKAVYLPSSMTNGKLKVIVPLNNKNSTLKIAKALPQRLIVKYSDSTEDIGLMVTTVGNVAVRMLESKPEPSASGVESALTYLFMGVLGVAGRTEVAVREHHIRVEIYNPHIENRETWSSQSLGSPLASIAASVVAEAWNRPFVITQEERNWRKHSVELKVVG